MQTNTTVAAMKMMSSMKTSVPAQAHNPWRRDTCSIPGFGIPKFQHRGCPEFSRRLNLDTGPASSSFADFAKEPDEGQDKDQKGCPCSIHPHKNLCSHLALHGQSRLEPEPPLIPSDRDKLPGKTLGSS